MKIIITYIVFFLFLGCQNSSKKEMNSKNNDQNIVTEVSVVEKSNLTKDKVNKITEEFVEAEKEIIIGTVETNQLSFDSVAEFVTSIKNTTLAHNRSKILNLFDEDYIQEQLNEVFEGDVDFFVNEIFCGYGEDKEKYLCMKFDEISNIEAIKLLKTDMEGVELQIIFKVTNTKSETITTANNWVIKKIINNKTYFGLYGPMG